MSYFNHAFKKTMLATKATQEKAGTVGQANGKAAVNGGILTTADVPVWKLKSTLAKEGYQLGSGVVGIFDAKTNLSVTKESALEEKGDKFYIAASALMQQDKIGPFHGGYQEASKSKVINPRFVHKAWKVKANEAIAPKLAIGAKYDADNVLQVCTDKQFFCEEHYVLRVDIKGESALRFTNHNIYRSFQAYTGCCKSELATVNPAVVYVQWAEQINTDPYTKDFVRMYIVDAVNGETYSSSAEDAALIGAKEDKIFSTDEKINTLPMNLEKVYMVMLGAYEDTKFGNCSFAPSDYYGKAPLRLYAEEVDLDGNPCTYTGICVENLCLGVQANGLGEQKLREVLLSESYLQNHMANDARIREITGGDSLLNSVDRNALYDSVFIQHSIPRYNNPTSTFDADQYLIEIVFENGSTGIAALEEIILPSLMVWSNIDVEETTTEAENEGENPTTEYHFVDFSHDDENNGCKYVFPVKA